MDISKLSLNEFWLLSDECKELTKRAEELLQKDELNPCNIEVINNQIPDEYQDEFWDDVMGYFDDL